MVLGLIDFLLGTKKKAKNANNAQQNSAENNSGANPDAQQTQASQGQDNQQNDNQKSGLQFQDSNSSSQSSPQSSSSSQGGKKSLSEILNNIRNELKETNDNVANINSEIKDIQGNVSSMDHRISELEEKNKTTEEKITDIDENMSKFLSLYELVNNQYNPFVEHDIVKPKKIVVGNDGENSTEDNQDQEQIDQQTKEKIKNIDLSSYNPAQDAQRITGDLKSSLLELDTLDIESAAADAIPLTNIKNNTNSLVIILSWLEYLVKRVGVEESKNALRYYTETLKWITPEVFFELDKFLRGMEDVEEAKAKSLDVKDHIVSLYFISKLNEKPLDKKLTNAVLQIIRQ
jgi:flagellar protein FlaD